MRKFALILPALLVAACDPVIPNSGGGVGFGDYVDYAAQRVSAGDQPVAQTPVASPDQGAPLSALAPQPVAPAASPEAALGADAMAALGLAPPEVAPEPAFAPVVIGGTAGPNLAAFALSTSHEPGTVLYQRGGLHLLSTDKSCAKFVSPDLAQMAFLEAGGPDRDSKNLDPDGDGYACGWDPRPFRAARN